MSIISPAMESSSEFDDGSWRHHYIPQYFVKGFVDADGMLFRYDKTSDTIESKRVHRKRIFFQENGNTAYVGSSRNTIGEKASASLDSVFADRLAPIRASPSDSSINNIENYVTLLSLAADLFFRVPANDQYYDLLYARTGLEPIDTHGNVIQADRELLEVGGTAQKSIRPFIPQNLLGQLFTQTEVHDKMRPRIASFSCGVFVLSDNPVVFSELPIRWQDFMQNFILPISSAQLFVYSEKPGLGRDLSLPSNYNALAINQAQRYVCSASKVILTAAVQYWKELRKRGYFPGKSSVLFEDALVENPTK
ncbi:MAG: DUF4238 domain-containing protein [Flavobacteriales bacterium]|nr:DUF4238 domain-containing protein [Flavobacteriales bacterium]